MEVTLLWSYAQPRHVYMHRKGLVHMQPSSLASKTSLLESNLQESSALDTYIQLARKWVDLFLALSSM